jgi:hypothetical protein
VCVCVRVRAEFMVLPPVRSCSKHRDFDAYLLFTAQAGKCALELQNFGGNGSLALLYIKMLIHTHNLFHVRVSDRTVCGSVTAHALTDFEVRVQSQRILCVNFTPAMALLQLYCRNADFTLLVMSTVRSVICCLW